MVPAPKGLQSPGILAAVRQVEVRPATATSLELGLITAALFVSSVLCLNPKRQPRNPVYSDFLIAIAVCFTLGAFGVAVATLTLGWLRVISLDAVAGIVFALGPAFVTIPREILTYSRDSVTSRLMWDHLSLNIPTAHFQYIRFDEGIHDRLFCFVESSELHAAAGGIQNEGNNVMFIRHLMNSSRHGAFYSLFSKFWNRFIYPNANPRAMFESRLNGTLTEEQQRFAAKGLHTVRGIHVYGIPIQEFSNFASVQDIDDGKTSWWWSCVSSARHVIARPSRVHLDSGRRVGNALALLSDIISIGDLVLHLHLDVLEWMLQMDHDVRAAVTSAPGLTCTRFVRELELDGWDSIGPEDLLPLLSVERTQGTGDSDKTENSGEIDDLGKGDNSDALVPQSKFSLPPSKHYALLFLILAEKSRRFLLSTTDTTGGMPSGQHVLDALWDARDYSRANFRKVALESVGTWLRGWGLNIALVQKARDTAMTVGQ